MVKSSVILHTLGVTPAGAWDVADVAVTYEPRGLGIHVTGLPDRLIKEVLLRVTTAIQSSGYKVAKGKYVISFTPKYYSSCVDLAVAMGVLAASLQCSLEHDISRFVFVGELGLDGQLRPLSLPYKILDIVAASPECDMVVAPAALEVFDKENSMVQTFNYDNLVDVVSFCSKPDLQFRNFDNDRDDLLESITNELRRFMDEYQGYDISDALDYKMPVGLDRNDPYKNVGILLLKTVLYNGGDILFKGTVDGEERTFGLEDVLWPVDVLGVLLSVLEED